MARLRARLDRDAVVLESVVTGGRGVALLAGTVLVAAAAEKRVTVRLTVDSWRSYVDVPAAEVPSGRPGTHLFAFDVAPDAAGGGGVGGPGGGVEFAVKYEYRAHNDADWTERWDNNDARNYAMSATW